MHEVFLGWFGVGTAREDRKDEKRSNRRKIQKGKLRTKQRVVKRRHKEAPIYEKANLKDLLNDIKTMILVISRDENQRKRRKKKRQSRR